jgi:hypothetical protein
MAARTAKVTQAELERAIRAAAAVGLPVVRIVARADGYAIETTSSSEPGGQAAPSKPGPVL